MTYVCSHTSISLTQAHVIGRILLSSVITIFRLEQIMTAKEDLDYPSLRHYRNANSHRMTFDDVLAKIVHTILERFGEMPSNSVPDNTNFQCSAEGQGIRTRSMKVRDVPLVTFTGNSPKRNVKSFYANPKPAVCQPILERRLNCAGNAVYRVDYDEKNKVVNNKGKGSRSLCALCSAFTNVWCTICHTWLCGPHVDRKCDDYETVIRLSLSGNVYCLNTCWMMWHENGLKRTHLDSIAEVTDEED